MKFAEFFKQARVKANFTQAKIAFHLGYKSSQFVSNWERGISTPPSDELLVLADFLRADPVKMIDLALAEKKYNFLKKTKAKLKKQANKLKQKNEQI